jgi:hypothetical protein
MTLFAFLLSILLGGLAHSHACTIYGHGGSIIVVRADGTMPLKR